MEPFPRDFVRQKICTFFKQNVEHLGYILKESQVHIEGKIMVSPVEVNPAMTKTHLWSFFGNGQSLPNDCKRFCKACRVFYGASGKNLR